MWEQVDGCGIATRGTKTNMMKGRWRRLAGLGKPLSSRKQMRSQGSSRPSKRNSKAGKTPVCLHPEQRPAISPQPTRPSTICPHSLSTLLHSASAAQASFLLRRHLPQGLCTCHSHHLECSFPRRILNSLNCLLQHHLSVRSFLTPPA